MKYLYLPSPYFSPFCSLYFLPFWNNSILKPVSWIESGLDKGTVAWSTWGLSLIRRRPTCKWFPGKGFTSSSGVWKTTEASASETDIEERVISGGIGQTLWNEATYYPIQANTNPLHSPLVFNLKESNRFFLKTIYSLFYHACFIDAGTARIINNCSDMIITRQQISHAHYLRLIGILLPLVWKIFNTLNFLNIIMVLQVCKRMFLLLQNACTKI